MIRRPPRSTQSRSSAASDVYKRQVRSLVSVPAGVARMPLWKFTLFTLVGSTVWNAGLVLGGYVLGSQFTEIGRYSDYINWAVYALIAYLVVRFVVRRRSRRADHPQP